MVILRRTQKLAVMLPAGSDLPARSDTALGDWYANRFTVDRRPLLILLSSSSLLPILIPARDLRALPDRLEELVGNRLKRLGVARHLIDMEVESIAPVAIGSTVDRSVVGIMVDFAKSAHYHLEDSNWDESTLPFVEARLAETPCYAGRRSDQVIFPRKAAPALLAAKWEGG